MPRPRKFEQRAFVGCYVEYETYLLIKELAFRKRMTLSDLLREAIEEYLRRHYREKVLRAQSFEDLVRTGETIQELEFKMSYLMLKEQVKLAERHLQALARTRKGTMDWYQRLGQLEAVVKKAFSLASKLPKPPEREVKRLIEIMSTLEALTTSTS